jgi:hypothetical protein
MILSDMQVRLLTRLGDTPGANPLQQHYPVNECTAALNQMQRIFVLFTLCLETTPGSALVLGSSPWTSMLTQYADWIAPLRFVVQSTNAKLAPRRVAEMAALDSKWTTTTGTPSSYCLVGFDLAGFYPFTAGTSLTPTYAQAPPVLVNAGDTPAIPERYHQSLIDGAIPVMRIKEGAQEWQKTLPLWDRFMDAVQECAAKVRARNMEMGYDTWPIELKRFDRSKLLKELSK